MKKIRFNIIFLVLVVCWSFAGCKTSQKFAQQTKQQSHTEVVSEQATQTVSVKDFVGIKDIAEDIEIEGTVWSAPDSTGTQYPAITFSGKKSNKTKIQEHSNEQSQQQADSKSVITSENVAEQTTRLETTRWTLGDIIHLSLAAAALIFVKVIYFKFFKK